jgi:hypothetical protein
MAQISAYCSTMGDSPVMYTNAFISLGFIFDVMLPCTSLEVFREEAFFIAFFNLKNAQFSSS